MKKSKSNLWIYYGLTMIGIVLFAIGGAGLKLNWFESIKAVPGILIGIGAGSLGFGLGEIIKQKTISNHPETKKKIEIAQTDERNLTILSKSKTKAFDTMGYVYPVVMFICILLNVEFTIVLLLVSAYILIYAVQIYYFNKYQKEM
ncbi:MAG: hypothetical protein CL609_20530 [Anaerolineaceae bacterium]|nr:hypothetical protein [Anaerolineaceae bacterium]